MTDYLASPVWGGFSREITQPWGPTTLNVEPYWPERHCFWHCGVDIGMATGTHLFAARQGLVSVVSYGLLVIHVGLEADCYVHIDQACVIPGQWVVRGQLVAFSGAKIPAGGSLTGPHLHFEVQGGRLNNPSTSLNPIPILEGPMTLDPNDPTVKKITDGIAVLLGQETRASYGDPADKNWADVWARTSLNVEQLLKNGAQIDPTVAADLHTVAEAARKLGIP